MPTATSITPADATNVEPDASQYTRIVKIIRNMTDFRYNEDTKVVVPVRTISNPSPPKKSASNRHPSQTHTRTPVDEAIKHELAKARCLMHDLADHVFGHIVSTKLARDILRQFVENGIVQVFKGASCRNDDDLLNWDCDDVQRAIEEAFEDADERDCIQLSTAADEEVGSSSTDTKEKRGKGKREAKTRNYSFKWTTFPMEPLREDKLVSFLNDITDHAFDIAKPDLAVSNPKLRHRFAAPEDKTHAIPLSYEPDGEDMRPDFLLLPIEAFKKDLKTVDAKYVNFTASRLVGESKNKDLAAGVEQMQRYARGLKRAQPWVYYVLGMAFTKDKAIFLRGEGSGTEHLELMLADGRGCIELIRILLGLALADKVDLGHNPDVQLEEKEQLCTARNVAYHSAISEATSRSAVRQAERGDFVPSPLSQVATSGVGGATNITSSHPRPVSTAPQRYTTTPSTSSKRSHSDIVDDEDDEGTHTKRRRTKAEAIRYVFFPVAVYGYKCLGLLFTASSIRGRGTTVFCVVDLKDKKKLLALKMAWQDLGRVEEQDAVMEHLTSKGPHPNLIIPLKMFKVERNKKMCTTLGTIRGFNDDQISNLRVENRVLTVSVFELKRPVKYFWGVHDFVRGIRGALLGHEYLTSIGILHRDISENNILLGLRPGDERGYLIDLDMAILQKAEEPTPAGTGILQVPFEEQIKESSTANTPQNGKPRPNKGLRTGTFPYISFNVLSGRRHTQFDDVESFLYVLFLFFFSYAGSLSDTELKKADEAGFAQSIGSGRLSHTRSWPLQYANWADGNPEIIGKQKLGTLVDDNGPSDVIQTAEFLDCLENNWPSELHNPISELVKACFIIFRNSMQRIGRWKRTEVSHADFISILDRWLDRHSGLEDRFSNCPFK